MTYELSMAPALVSRVSHFTLVLLSAEPPILVKQCAVVEVSGYEKRVKGSRWHGYSCLVDHLSQDGELVCLPDDWARVTDGLEVCVPWDATGSSISIENTASLLRFFITLTRNAGSLMTQYPLCCSLDSWIRNHESPT